MRVVNDEQSSSDEESLVLKFTQGGRRYTESAQARFNHKRQ